MAANEKIKKILIIIAVGYIAVLFLSFIGGSILNIIDPPEETNYYTSDNSYSSSSSHHYTSSPSSSSNSHYSVRTDPYELARNDPGSYYDHYEYGDNYEIDDYLESEGYD